MICALRLIVRQPKICVESALTVPGLKMFKTIAKRCFSCGKLKAPKVCIVGAGPAGFYAAQHLHKKLVEAEIDIIERLPVPFGLVRYNFLI